MEIVFMFFSFILIFACADKTTDTSITEDTAEIETPSTGALALRFSIDEDYAAIMDEPPTGVFYGSFWLAEDVDALGPIDGRESLYVFQATVDLPMDGSPTDVVFTQEELPAEEVYILGFLDSDGNNDPENTNPDSKDPVTIPSENDFDVVGGETTEVNVFMSMLYPG